jgi:predicted Fe-Mo cluster-binding NifX family protein
MRVCVSATSGSLDAQVDPRFGRCQYFVIVDSETTQSEAMPNSSTEAMGGAGIQAAQTIANKGVKALITGNIGPNAYQVLSSAGIEILTGASGTVREAVESFKNGKLRDVATGPTASAHSGMSPGMGGGMGMGRGMGSGRGMGMGRGMGRGMGLTAQPPIPQASPVPPASKEQEIQMLNDQMKGLQQQLEQIKKRMQELGKD